MSATHDVTDLLAEWARGNRKALEPLTPLVPSELRQLAAGYLRPERPDQTLLPTALLHEACLRLVDQANPNLQNRSHFCGVAARRIRQILVEHARRRLAGRRAGQTGSLGTTVSFVPERASELVALDDALSALEELDPRKSKAVELRCFWPSLNGRDRPGAECVGSHRAARFKDGGDVVVARNEKSLRSSRQLSVVSS